MNAQIIQYIPNAPHLYAGSWIGKPAKSRPVEVDSKYIRSAPEQSSIWNTANASAYARG